MTCPTCRNPIPNHLLVCLGCTMQRSKLATEAYQLDPLRKVREGRGELVVRSVEGKRHLQMYGTEMAFCGLPVNLRFRRTRMPWSLDLPGICTQCRSEITRLMEQACQDFGSI